MFLLDELRLNWQFLRSSRSNLKRLYAEQFFMIGIGCLPCIMSPEILLPDETLSGL